MLEHLSKEQIDGYERLSLPAPELFAIDDHLAQCDSCRERIASAMDLPSRAASLVKSLSRAEDDHLDYERLEGYVDDTLPAEDREAVEIHLEECSDCRDEVKDLNTLKLSMSATEPVVALPVDLRDEESEPMPSGAGSQFPPITQFNTLARNKRRLILAFAMAASLAIAAIIAFQQEKHKDHSHSIATRNNDIPSSDEAAKLRIAAALKTGEIDQSGPEIQSLKGKHEDILGTMRTSFKAEGPIGTAIRTDQPQLRWTAVAGATSYIVKITSPAGSIKSLSLTSLTWKPEQALPRGAVLTWQVQAMNKDAAVIDTAPIPPGHFIVLTPERLAQVVEGERLFHDDPLSLGIFYAQFGLVDDAMSSLKTAQAGSPSNPVIPKLLEKLEDTRGIMR